MSDRQESIKRLRARAEHVYPDAMRALPNQNAADKLLLEHADRRFDTLVRLAVSAAWLAVALWVILVFCGCLKGPPIAKPGELRADVAARASSALRLEVTCINGDTASGSFGFRMGMGSGVVVSATQALTAFHVVDCPDDGTPRIQVVTVTGQKMVATVELVDEAADVARVRLVSGLFPSSGPPRVSTPKVGMRVCTTTGVPERGEMCGNVLAATTLKTGGILHTVKSIAGNSGSGMYSEDGALVGIVVQRIPCPGAIADSCGGRATSLSDRSGLVP